MNGSIWRKWDLHFHSPSSYDYHDKRVTNQKLIETLIANAIEVVAITDHHIIDVDRIKHLQKLGDGKITVLPGIELRSELGGSESVHFIGLFSEFVRLDELWIDIQSRCNLRESERKEKGDDKIYCDLVETAKLVHQWGGLVSIHAGDKSNSIENITNSLSYKMAIKDDVTKSVDIFELGNQEDQSDYITKVFPSIKRKYPMILCSDNHNINKYVLKQNFWIKADPTFEGLRQIVFEPESRVRISELPPIDPPNRIKKVSFSFPDKCLIGNDVFCLSGKKEMSFSSNLTCIIGGRGTGKSTILNLIDEKSHQGENEFFSETMITDTNMKRIEIASSVVIDEGNDDKNLEYLSQNEIEDFASNDARLTESLYPRILKLDTDNRLYDLNNKIIEQTNSLEEHIKKIRAESNGKNMLATLERQRETQRNIANSLNSEVYQSIQKKLQSAITLEGQILNSKKAFEGLIGELRGFASRVVRRTENNEYDIGYNKLADGIEELIKHQPATDFTEEEKRIKQLKEDRQNLAIESEEYLKNQGLSSENTADLRNATVNISVFDDQIDNLKASLTEIRKQIDNYDITSLESAKNLYKSTLLTHIEKINVFLEKSLPQDVKNIRLDLGFNIDLCKEAIFQEFKRNFDGNIESAKIKGDGYLKDVLFTVDPDKLSTQDDFVNSLKKTNTSSQAKPFLIELFTSPMLFAVYKLITIKHLSDIPKYKLICAFYDNKSLNRCSFGQRCTAAIVLLLSLGNNPIIIDEPETHLDSLLISQYLVDLIKTQKQNRQIIFATHNANFVVNGDAELIHVLTVDQNNLTKIVSTTIENQNTRDDLLSLEGGQEAFVMRENKYCLR